MHVLIWTPRTSVPGGHLVQALRTYEGLHRLGVSVTMTEDTKAPEELVRQADIVHGFGVTLDEVRACRTAGKRVALSTIYVSTDYYSGALNRQLTSRAMKDRARAAAVLGMAVAGNTHHRKMLGYTARTREMAMLFESADMLLPNSALEAAAIRHELGVTTPVHVVPNAVEPANFVPAWGGERTRSVLMVGRFEPHKNQLGLIRATKNLEVPVTLVGPRHPDHDDYYSRCRTEARGANVNILTELDHKELVNVYRAHSVHALPSFFETTGLVSLEAALAGCVIVTTSRGYAREYFKDNAFYCDPERTDSIRRALFAALDAAPSVHLRDRILDQYTWDATAAATRAAYQEMLDLPQP